MNTRKFLRGTLALLLLAVPVDCAKRSIHRKEPILETSRAHYLQGQQHLSQGDLQEATRQFQLAVFLDPDYAPAYEGLGLIKLEQGDFQGARRYFEEGRQRDNMYAPLYVGLGRILSAQGRDQEAIGQFQRALELDPGYADAFYYLGKTYVDLGKYSQAEECFKKALDRNPAHVLASEDWALLVRLRTSPEDLPPEYVAIVKKPVATRADFAALLAHQLPLSDLCGPGEQEPSVSDIEESWARWEIQQVVACGLMPVYPDGEFKPRQKMTRLHCALAVKEVLLRATEDPQLTQQFVGQSSPYPDLPKGHDGFGAVMLATARGIMKAKADGFFGPDDAITGYTAMKIVRALKGQL